MKIRPYGDAAVLAELADLDEVMHLAGVLRRLPMVGITDVVPAARTVLVRFDPARTTQRQVSQTLHEASSRTAVGSKAQGGEDRSVIELPVVYDGDDLDEVGRLTGLGRDGVVDAHTAVIWTVAFCGFAPGFAYCVSSDARLHVPRRSNPRTRVPAGSVGLAGEFTGVYPSESPGGWQLLGHTKSNLWDLDRNPPALLPPGGFVRFRAASA